MWLTLILSGALHGLVLLPVVLSIAGGPGFTQQEADEEWMSNAIRHDYEYTYVIIAPITSVVNLKASPFLADDDGNSIDD